MDNIKVYYNSACPVCKAGIEDQRCRMIAQDINNIEWIDVHMQPDSTKEIHADLEVVRERLHIKKSDGTVLVGTDAFAALFEETNGQRTLGRILKIAGIRSLSQIAYNAFARILYRWNRIKGRW